MARRRPISPSRPALRGVGAWLLGCLLAAAVPRGARADTARVEIDGVRGETRQNLELVLRDLQLDGSTDLSPVILESRVGQLEEMTRQALEPFGHYQPRVTIDRSGTDGQRVIHLVVDPGPVVRIRELELGVDGPGAEDPRVRRARDGFPLTVGQPLLHGDWELGKASLQLAAETSGYLEAVLAEHTVEVDVGRSSADARLRFYTGRRFEFGPLLTEQTALSSQLFANYVNFLPGDPFSYETLQELQNALAETGYFDRIEVEALPQLEGPLPPLEVPIRVTATPARPQKYRVGIGYRTDIGARLSLGAELRRINQRGHRFDTQLQIAEKQEVLRGVYTIPSLSRPRTDRVAFDLAYGNDRPETSETQAALAGVGISRKRGPWEDVLGLHYRRDDFEIGGATARNAGAGVRDITDLVILDASRTFVERDDPIYVRHGRRLVLELQGAESSVLSDTTFVRAITEGKWIHALGDHGRFLARASLGYVSTSDFAKLPPHLRFFTGGDQSIRGFGYQALGPANDAGVVLGGDSLAIGSIEYEHRLFDHRKLGRWSLAAFVDGGDAFDADDPPSFGDLASGAGLGLRWLSPIGLVRIDVATAWTEPGSPVRLHLTIGPDL